MISKILVANRGEIARRVFRTCRLMGIATVAVYSDPDDGEPHVREADEAIRLTGSNPSETYLDIEAVLAAAEAAGADAVHPGYGFLAESARFAAGVEGSGLTWIGPSSEAIRVMGSKLESKHLMERVGIPILESVEIDDGASASDSATRLGYPVLVKASAGGGGKGMRIVEAETGLEEAIDSARREAAGAFGDDTVFLERYLDSPRHIEIQVFGDSHDNLIAIHERECSIQRRHQKIIEEAPSPAIDASKREEMSEAAVRAASAIGYVGAGTVEFLYHDGGFFFLEMNTRLQVEHPVTEMVTGLDLVRLQIEVANGGVVPETAPPLHGHAIEARLYAEDPLNEFLPMTGVIHRFDFGSLAGVRVDAGVEGGSKVSVHYDPMIAKVIAHAPDRRSAAALLADVLRRAHVHAPTTNRALLVRVLESEEFLSGDTDTHFLVRHPVAELGRPLGGPRDEAVAAMAVAIADQALGRETARVLASIPSGWRNSPSGLQTRSYEGAHGAHDVRYSVSPDGFADESLGHVKIISAGPSRVVLSVDGDEQHFEIGRYGVTRFVDSEHVPVMLTEIPRYPTTERDESAGSLHAPMPGKVTKVEVEAGERVDEGQVLVVMEAMKMEHALRSPHPGVVSEVRHRADDQVDGGAILVVVTPDPD